MRLINIKVLFIIAVITAFSAVMTSTVSAGPMSSTNYSIKKGVFASGGASSSASYKLASVIGQSSAVGESSSTNYLIVGGFVPRGSILDTDGDGVPDSSDNCTLVANADQRDTNGDGYGNMCDGDLDNNERTNTIDLNLYKQVHRSTAGDGRYDPDADFNGDGRINTIDLNIYKGLHRKLPGPSCCNV